MGKRRNTYETVAALQVRDDDGEDCCSICKGGERGLDSRCLLEIELTYHGDRMNTG